MKIGDLLYGFTVSDKQYIEECEAYIYLMDHKSGASVAFLDREDENKTFAISFLTPPEDDTGVFHIIEHSTLCGSERFPVKEPFVELLKGSLNTFLNAMTYEDRTVYPVSSRCDKDFYNLTNVYLDAVFYPLMRKNPFIFEQEGWRYEYNESTGKLSYNGVVYNEMKGAYSSPEDMGYAQIVKLLYGGTSYGKDSGGDPDFIPDLTYSEFCRLHEKYYHPTNSYIYLDGSVDLDSILPLIDSYLAKFEKKEEKTVLAVQCESGKKCSELFYEVSEKEDISKKSILLIGFPYSSFDRTDEKIFTSVITSHLASSNDSPLVKALLDSGLCEDVIVGSNASLSCTLTVEIKGFDKKDKDAILEIFDSTVEKECLGMDRASLHASLNRIEFKLRERELGTFPMGVANALSVYEIWSYGGHPKDGLVFENDIRKVRLGIDSGEAEKLLEKIIKNNKNRAQVLLLPSTAAANERAAALEKKLAERLEKMSEEELSAIKANQEKFTLWQHSEDSDEAIETLPRLTLEDIKPSKSAVTTERSSLLGADVIRHRVGTRGITYISMFFDASDIGGDELSRLALLANVLTDIKTEHYSVTDLKNEIKNSLGILRCSSSVISNSKKGFTKPTIRFSASVLDEKRDRLADLLAEILYSSVYSDLSAIKKRIVQTVSDLEDSFISSGESAAMGRVEAMSSDSGRVSELLHGYDFYINLKKLLTELDNSPTQFSDKLSKLAERLFVRERLTLSVTTDKDGFEEELLERIKEGRTAEKAEITEKLPAANEGISIPSRVGYAAYGTVSPKAIELLGALRVARSILSYEYLWNNIRVKGGAYGAGFVTRKNGGLFFYSYRDPSPEKSVNTFKHSSDYLKEIASRGEDLTKFIIGAYGEYDYLKTPKIAAEIATANALTDWTENDEMRLCEGILNTKTDDLVKVAELLEYIQKDSCFAVAASAETLYSFKEKFDNILKI